MRDLKKGLISTLLWFVFISGGSAEENSIATDRPDFVESADTVGLWNVQVETSYEEETDTINGVTTKSESTPTLIRLGILKNLELRMETAGFISEKTDNQPSNNGSADPAFGFKVHFLDGTPQTLSPSMAVLVHADMDSGSAYFRGHGIRPSLRVVGEWEGPADLSMGLMPGVAYESDDNNNRYTNVMVSGVLGRGITESLRAFVELTAEQLVAVKHGGNILTFDAGMAYVFLRNYQFDVASSWGLNDNSPDFSWTLGFSMKIGKSS